MRFLTWLGGLSWKQRLALFVLSEGTAVVVVAALVAFWVVEAKI